MAGFTFVRTALMALGLAAAGSASAQVVISQAYGGGGNSGATYTHDFVELFNRGSDSVSLNGWTVQYTSAAGTSNWIVSSALPDVTLQPGRYYLVQLATGGSNGSALPSPDFNGGNVNMSGTSGKVALASNNTGFSGACPSGAQLVDFVGFGSPNCSEGNSAAPAPSNQNAIFRASAGCQDTNVNSADFAAAVALARNSSTPINLCTPPSTPLVSFDAAAVSATEGSTGDSNPLNFIVNIEPAPAAGAPVSFDIEVSGEAGRFAYSGPAALTVTDATLLPVTITVDTVGNDATQGNSIVTLTLSNFTGTAPQQPSSLAKQGTIIEDDLLAREIFEIQGSGVCSPFVSPCNIAANVSGEPVRSTINIVTAVGGAGFTMQTPDALDDNNPLTSNGIYVFTATAPRTDGGELLAVGDAVAVIGRAAEFFGLTQIAVNSTRDVFNSVQRSASSQPLPTAIEFSPTSGIPSKDPASLSCGALGNFECFEGMRVSIPNGAVVAANQRFATDPYAEVYVSTYGERAVREKGARFGNTLVPANQAAGVWDGNPEVIEMDADFLLPNNAGLELNGGTRFDAIGVIGFDFGDYEFWPTELGIVPGSNHPQRAVPESASNELTIGSFNAFRLCDAVAGNTTVLCTDTEALEIDTARVTHQVGQVSAYIRELLRSPDVVGLQEVENLAVLQQLADQIATDGGPAYTAYLVEGNDVGGIDVGYLINPARVQTISVTQLAATETWNDPGGTPTSILHDRPPLLLTADFVGHGESFRFHVINNHTRSRGGADTSNAAGERLRAKRFTQGASIANLVQGLQTAPVTADVPLFVIGDHNAYQFTDGYVDKVGLIAGTYVNDENTCAPANAVTTCKLPGGANIVSPAMVNAVLLLDQDEQYSYNFTEVFGSIQGTAGRDVATNQVLDHALFNLVAEPYVTGMAYARGNVDASRQRFRDCNYTNRNLTACPQGPASWVPVGASDHDGLVLFVSPPRQDAIFANGFETID